MLDAFCTILRIYQFATIETRSLVGNVSDLPTYSFSSPFFIASIYCRTHTHTHTHILFICTSHFRSSHSHSFFFFLLVLYRSCFRFLEPFFANTFLFTTLSFSLFFTMFHKLSEIAIDRVMNARIFRSPLNSWEAIFTIADSLPLSRIRIF